MAAAPAASKMEQILERVKELRELNDELTAEELMAFAEADFNICVERGEWRELSEDKRSIIAHVT